MANQLLAARGEGYVGEKWVRNFVRRKTELKSQLTRQRDRQRVLCSDPGLITPYSGMPTWNTPYSKTKPF
jgi:hypothetical protein